jgi:Xaa-Pro aminopeptidase
MFEAEVYSARRDKLASKIKDGVIILMGNKEVGMNYSGNTYKFRQDSTFLYYFGLNLPDLVGIIDAETHESMLFGDDLSMDDIVWTGPQPTVNELAASVGVTKSDSIMKLFSYATIIKTKGRKIHFLPFYRGDNEVFFGDLMGIEPHSLLSVSSRELIHAVVDMRLVKEDREIAEIEKACAIGSKMHKTAMKMCKSGVTEQHIGAIVDSIAYQYGSQVSFPTILTQHGETMHNSYRPIPLKAGKLMLTDAGAENEMNYCSDFTRTIPVSGKYDSRQRDIYQAVLDCHNLVPKIAKPGITWFDVHMRVCQLLTERLQALGLMKGNVEDSVNNGAHALFFPHGLGHNMGLDVHDMESLGQEYVGFDDEVRPVKQFGTNALRMGRRLVPGYVITDEPGCYFIPQLIAQWKADKTNAEYLNFDKIEQYLDFGGVRIEDDVLITEDGCRFLGEDRAPVEIKDIEAFMENN